MNRAEVVKEYCKTSIDYGRALYQFRESRVLLKREKSTLKILCKWENKPETRKVTAHSLEILRQEILMWQHRIWIDAKDSKSLSREAASLKRLLANKMRKLLKPD